MQRKVGVLLIIVAMVISLLGVLPVSANPPAPDDTPVPPKSVDFFNPAAKPAKGFDQPNPKDLLRIRERQQLLDEGKLSLAAPLAKTGQDRVLVVLVEFAGTDVFTWTEGTSGWDPLGRADGNEAVTDENGNVIAEDCSKIISQTKAFTYAGPLHNQIPRPLSANDRSGTMIWTPDFSRQWYQDFMFGNGVVFDYARQDESQVHEDFTGKSVRQYYEDMSAGRYSITGTVVGWLQLPHSTWWYGADPCPGARSGTLGGFPFAGGIPGAGNSKSLVKDALDAVNAISDTLPGFQWSDYDQDGDGVIDRLWIVHAGYGEEDATDLLNRTDYGEGSMWSHSSSVTPAYPVGDGVAAGPYIMMPENGGIGVFAHESAHNIGAGDLYAYGNGEPSAGFWTLMSDDWTGYPIGYEPPALDPLHLDEWGWLDPMVITDATRSYTFKIGQASNFPGGEEVYRGARIELPTSNVPFAVQPIGNYQWWGGKGDVMNSIMISKQAMTVPPTATLAISLAYGIESNWDFLWVGVGSTPAMDLSTWHILTNTHTVCEHSPDWIGALYGLPEDLCGAGLGGFTDYNAEFPNYGTETFDLSAYAGQNLYLAFWYMTDWGTTYEGPFVDNVTLLSNGVPKFFDGAENGDGNWNYLAAWNRNNGVSGYSHNYYLQWRNVNPNGGYDSALGTARWRFGPANSGLLVWYNNNQFTDNEIFSYLTDYPGFGPKGRMLVVDSHPEPYRDPSLVDRGYNNEASDLFTRGLMRDAPFTLADTVGFSYPTTYSGTMSFAGRPAVSTFSDALGYYPGGELIIRSPSQLTPAWMTSQWDASAVVPSKAFYGIKAPGYTGDQLMRFGGTIYPDGRVLAWSTQLGYDGGTGNPGDLKTQYGWRVQVIEEAPDHTWATVRVYNALYDLRLPMITRGATTR